MNSFIKILLLLLSPFFVDAQIQQKKLDSLQMLLKNASDDTLRMAAYDDLAYFYTEVNNDSAIFYYDKKLLLTRQLNLKINEVETLDMKGYILSKKKNYPQSLETFLQALKIAQDPASEKNTWHLSNGHTPHEARLLWLGWIYNDRGDLYHYTGNLDQELEGYLQARNIAESVHDDFLLVFAYGSLATFYLRLGKLDSALLYEKKALALSLHTPKDYQGLRFRDLGEIYLKMGHHEKARNAFFTAVKINEEQINLSYLGDSYMSLAHLYQTEKNQDSALLFTRKGLETYKKLKRPEGIASAYSLLSSVYSNQNKTDSALAYLKLSTEINDSLNDVEKKNLVAFQNVGFNERLRLEELEKEKIETHNTIRTYGMLTGIGVFMLISFLLFRNSRNRRKANDLLQKQKTEIEKQKKNVEGTLSELKATQTQLIQSEKMASLGELTAGIAHEIQNPLNFVNNFSEVNTELIDELNEQADKGNIDEVKAIAKDIKENEQKINHHGKRADAIVKGMLQHTRSSTGAKEPTDINVLTDEYLRLCYHGLRAKDKSFNAAIKTDFGNTIGKINIVPQDIGRVLLNLYNNAFYAVNEKQKQLARDLSGFQNLTSLGSYEPTVTVSTKKSGNQVFISVSDNGNGIPQNIVDKIFQPFFTTKPTGQGTGLGLSLSYDIIKAHGGEIKVESKDGEESVFVIQLPFN